MKPILITNANIVNEGKITHGDILIENGRIVKIGSGLTSILANVIDAAGKYVIPGIIDDQVHFREPGLTHKANIYTESKAAVAGGVTSFMEMPNTVPNTLTQALLEEKYQIAANTSLANYSFFMGASNDNLEEVLKTNKTNVCGIKIFMGSSTGNMLVDNEKTLASIFSESPMLIAVHCENEQIIKENTLKYKEKYGEDLPVEFHPYIRDVNACYTSSSMAVDLAKRYNSRLHILHISTEEELALFDNTLALANKKITAEVCVHHLWFDSHDYILQGTRIKCNPAIKESRHGEALLKGLLDDRLDVIATDHAPHTLEEKNKTYFNAPSGLPLVQHALQIMLSFYKQNKISLEKIVEKMCHAPAICFQIADRGFIREGYMADLVIVDMNKWQEVTQENILYKCAWSPLEGYVFHTAITHTIINGNLVFENGVFNENQKGERLRFNR